MNFKIFNNSEGTDSQKYVLYTNSIYLKKEGHTSEYVAQLTQRNLEYPVTGLMSEAEAYVPY